MLYAHGNDGTHFVKYQSQQVDGRQPRNIITFSLRYTFFSAYHTNLSLQSRTALIYRLLETNFLGGDVIAAASDDTIHHTPPLSATASRRLTANDFPAVDTHCYPHDFSCGLPPSRHGPTLTAAANIVPIAALSAGTQCHMTA